MDTPVTSGNELIGNPGNAALGYSSGVAYGTNPATTNYTEGVDNTLARIQQQDAAMRMQKHLEQRQDMDDLYKMLAETKGSLFNMKDANGNNVSFTPLPEDKKILDQKADEKMRLVLNNPGHYKTMPELHRMDREISELKDYANGRAYFSTKEGLAASAEQNSTERANRLKNRDEQLSSPLTDYKPLNPYMEGPKFVDRFAGDKRWDDPKNQQEYGTEIVSRNGVDYEVKKHGFPANEIYSPLNDESKEGITNATNGMNIWRGLPEAHNPDYINKMNSVIKTNADAMGKPPVYEAWVNPDGTIQYNQNPREWLTAHNLYSYGSLRTTEKISDAAEKRKTAEADIQDKKDKLDLAKKEFKLKQDKQSQDTVDKASESLDASVAAKQVSDLFDNKSKDKSGLHNILTGYNHENKGYTAPVPALAAELRKGGINPTLHQFVKLNQGDQNIREMLGVNEVPEEAYLVHDPQGKGDDMIAALVPKYEKLNVTGTGQEMKKMSSWMFVTKKDATANKIDAVSKKAKTLKVANEINSQNEEGADSKKQAPQLKRIKGKFTINGETKTGYRDAATGKIYEEAE